MKKTSLVALAGIMGAACLSVGATETFAWENQQPDPNTTVQTVEKKDSATIPAEGVFKKFDPTTNPGGGDPTPGNKDKAWIDVNIPDKLFFGQTDVSKGIIAPTYAIENLSVKGVKVSVSDFQAGSDADKLPELELGLLNLDSSKTISLVNADPAKAPAFPAEVADIPTQGGKINFTLNGDVGKSFNFSQQVNPKYTLVLQFEVL